MSLNDINVMLDYSTLNLKDAREMIKHVQKHGGVRFIGDV